MGKRDNNVEHKFNNQHLSTTQKMQMFIFIVIAFVDAIKNAFCVVREIKLNFYFFIFKNNKKIVQSKINFKNVPNPVNE